MLIAFSTTIVLIAVGVAATMAPRDYGRVVLIVSLAMLAFATGVWVLIIAGPRDLWVRYPILLAAFHPYVLALDSIVALVFGLGLLLRRVLSFRSSGDSGWS